ncbi:cell division protein FtsQ/DivIB [Humibacillus xanthopallidus]|uniref:cell division protein FtsQ/DivIB n=1 Tax=Humibacillus xanthopallidus TaxID=412689 RepID=UPI00384DCD15
MLDRSTRSRAARPTPDPSGASGSSASPAAGWRTSRATRVAGRGLASSRRRFERRAAAARRRPRLLIGIGVALLLLLGLVVWLGWFSSVFTATAVEVRGASGAAAAQVRQVAAVPLGGPVMRVDTDAVQERLVAGKAWREVSVSRSLPHTVVIDVTPRVAVLAVRGAGGRVELVDAEGVVFARVASPPAGVPVVASGAATVTRAGVTAALQALGSLEPALRRTVSGVTVSEADQVSFRLKVKDATKTIVWGGSGDGATKAKLVAVLVSQPGSTIDVSVPGSPVTR